MQQNKSSSKGTIIGVIVVIIVSLGIYFYLNGNPSDSSITSIANDTPNSAEASIAANKVLVLLNQIKVLKIDPTIFTTDTYQSLVDYSIQIPEQNVGRPNPFAPIGGVQQPANNIKLPSTGR